MPRNKRDGEENKVAVLGVIVLLILIVSMILTVDAVSIPSDLREGDLIYGALVQEHKLLKEATPITYVKKGEPGHIGIIVRDEKDNLVVRHAHPSFDGKNGVFNTPVENFVEHYKTVEFLKVNVDDDTSINAAEYAKTLKGDFQIDLKEIGSNDKWYCSELVYNSYLKGADINLAKHHLFPWVSPKDIRNSNMVVEPVTMDNLGGINFSSINIAYIYTDSSISSEGRFDYFEIVLKATKEDKIGIDLGDASKTSVKSFFIALSLPDDKFWVNLNPWEPDRIIDDDLRKTDVGQIMLEADLQMKKDFCKYENPCESETGENYWELLDKKAAELVEECARNHPGEIKGPKNVLFKPVTRHWIVPGTTTVYENANEIYVANASLDIYSEPVFEHSTYEIVNQAMPSEACKNDLGEAAKEFGRYSKELEEEMILPFVVQDVNSGDNYVKLRQIYASLVLAQWYKERGKKGLFSELMDSCDLTDLEAEEAWDADAIWKGYVKSFEEGEFQCWNNTTRRIVEDTRIIEITESKLYSSGGVDFTAIETESIGDIPQEVEDLVSEAIYTSFVAKDANYYFGDCLFMIHKDTEGHNGHSHESNDATPTPKHPEDHEDHSHESHNETIPASKRPQQPGATKSPGYEVLLALLAVGITSFLISKKKSD